MRSRKKYIFFLKIVDKKVLIMYTENCQRDGGTVPRTLKKNELSSSFISARQGGK